MGTPRVIKIAKEEVGDEGVVVENSLEPAMGPSPGHVLLFL